MKNENLIHSKCNSNFLLLYQPWKFKPFFYLAFNTPCHESFIPEKNNFSLPTLQELVESLIKTKFSVDSSSDYCMSREF